MIQNIPSIYNQPSVYNGGGGLPGDFGNGAGVVPTGYRQVAGVYVRDYSGTGAYKEYSLNDVFGITLTDLSGIKAVGRFFVPTTPTQGNTTYFFRITGNGGFFTQGGEYPWTNFRLYSDFGSGVVQPFYGAPLLGVFDISASAGVVDINGHTFNITYNPPINNSTPKVSPFAVRRYNYECQSCNVATLFAKYYNANDELMLFFIPAVREADGIPGLYELVHDVFCDNGYCNVIEKIEA